MKITKNLKTILAELEESPKSAVELNDKLMDINKSVIYRTLKRLLRNGMISEIQLNDGSILYELSKENDHHHHIICIDCNDIKCVDLPDYLSDGIDKFEKELSQTNDIIEHRTDFFVHCDSCRS